MANTKKKPAKAGVSLTRLELRVVFRYLSAPMHGDDAKFRHEILKILRPAYEKIIDGRQEIMLSYSEKGEDGKPLILDGQYKILAEKKGEATQKSVEYLLGDSGVTLDKKTATKLVFVIDKNNRADMDIDEADIYYQVLAKLESK